MCKVLTPQPTSVSNSKLNSCCIWHHISDCEASPVRFEFCCQSEKT
ncbi:unnamed protein product [Schistosoma curassoni]|uniref:Uncharacterized protein n=1 Tax=Schistosoma curassoni TaxID=6186 RepID=A0A183JLE2_9TREM|nr:unnamed protein product [Schistosoma curassoni]